MGGVNPEFELSLEQAIPLKKHGYTIACGLFG